MDGSTVASLDRCVTGLSAQSLATGTSSGETGTCTLCYERSLELTDAREHREDELTLWGAQVEVHACQALQADTVMGELFHGGEEV